MAVNCSGLMPYNVLTRKRFIYKLTDAVAINVGNGIFGRGTGPIFFHDVDCIGNETNLFDCSGSVIVGQNCFHSKDAGVICPQGIVVYSVCANPVDNINDYLPWSLFCVLRIIGFHNLCEQL